jgi:3-deoxy-D-manno-octulosonic acid (KDO) 8-phosphate synthase
MGDLTEQQQKVSILLKKSPLIISGPCSAETEEQVMQTAIRLAATGKVDIMRAGIWKPRTRPGSFEGIGTKGLPWMQQAKKETGLPIAVEVATAKQVEDALHFGVDVLWIGARTTVNPFSVQEIADALRGVIVPVLIKNQLNPDLELRPSIFLKNAATTQFDINCNVYYKNKIWGGLSYRLQDAVIVMVGADVYKGLKLGLAYDVNTSSLNPYNNGTLEFMLNYCFKIKTDKPRQIYRNVRYL